MSRGFLMSNGLDTPVIDGDYVVGVRVAIGFEGYLRTTEPTLVLLSNQYLSLGFHVKRPSRFSP